MRQQRAGYSRALLSKRIHRTWQRGRAFHGLNYLGGPRRHYDIHSWAELDGSTCFTPDLKNGQNLDDPVQKEQFRQEAVGAYQWGHFSWPCFSWSPALSLPPGGEGFGIQSSAPVGPYRGAPPHHNGLPALKPTVRVRVDTSTRLKDLGLDIALDIHNGGGSVTIESSPDCRDPTDKWFCARHGFSTASQWPLWEDPAVKEYIRITNSTLVTRPMRAFGSPYRAYRTLCLNPLAYDHAQPWIQAPLDVPPGIRMSGLDANGQAHGDVAGQYTPEMSEMLYGIHRDAMATRQLQRSAKQKASQPPPPSPSPPPAPPDTRSPLTRGGDMPPPPPRPPAVTSRGGSSDTRGHASRVNADAPPACDDGARPTAGGAVASLVLLVVVMAGRAMVCLTPGGHVAQAALQAPFTAAGRKSVVSSAATLLSSHYHLSEMQAPLLFAGAFPKRSPVEYVVAAMVEDAVVDGVVSSLADVGAHLANELFREHIALAVASVQRLLHGGAAESVPLPPGCVLGSGMLQAVAVEPAATNEGSLLFKARQAQDASQHDLARRALDSEARKQAAQGDMDLACYLHEVATKMACAPLSDVPSTVASTSQATEDWMQYEPLYVKCPLTTAPLPASRPQPATSATFTTMEEMHNQAFLDRMQAWLDEALAWMIAVARGDANPPSRPDCFVASNDEAFKPKARGYIWDLRRVTEGIITPLDFTAKQASDWNVPWLREQWRHYVDQEAVSHACDGANLKLELDYQYCFSPHLLSLADGYAECIDDLVALRDEGFYAWFNTLPFCPCRFNGQGTRPKGLGFRRIASGSCPYEPILDSSGRLAYSINADSRRLRAERGVTVARKAWRTAFLATIFVLLLTKVIRFWPCLHAARKRFRKEVKPRVRDAMRNTVVFRAVGDRIGQPVYYFSDDFRAFFYQVKLAVHCLWFSGIYMYDPVSAMGVFIVELVLAMGYSPSSNIAQMVCDAILYIFDNMMEEAETHACDTSDELLAWMAARAAKFRHQPAQSRPWTSKGYTDDCLFTFLGLFRFVRGVCVWRRLLRTARIQGAKADKRQAGTWVLFLGVTLFATAVIASVPEHKLVRALLGLAQLVDGLLSKEATGRLLGLLVHLSFLSATGRASTYGMWRCLRHGRSDPVLLFDDEVDKARAWTLRLRTSHATAMDVAMRRRQRNRTPPATAVVITGQSDAYSTALEPGNGERAPEAGAGGYVLERVWRVSLDGALLRAPISGIELLAFMLHLIYNADVCALADFVDHFVDNMNSYLALVGESAGAPFMQWLYDNIRAHPLFRAVAHKLRVGQRWGVWLVLADAASRGYKDVVATVRARSGVNIVWMAPNADASLFVERASTAYARIELMAVPPPQLAAQASERPERHDVGTRARAPRRSNRLALLTLFTLFGRCFGTKRVDPAFMRAVAAPSPTYSTWNGAAVAAMSVAAAGLVLAAQRRKRERREPRALVGDVVKPTRVVHGHMARAPATAPLFAPRPPAPPAVAKRPAQQSRREHSLAAVRRHTMDLESEGSKFDLRPVDPARWWGLMRSVDDMIQFGVNANTSKGEQSAWNKYYLPYCTSMRTSPWREFEARRRPANEAKFACGFAMHVWESMAPRSAKDKAPRVDSVRNVLGHVRRLHERRGQEFIGDKAVAHLLKGITRKRIHDYGIAMPVRAEPFTVQENIKMKRVPRTTHVLGKARSEQFWDGWRLNDTYADQAGPRKAELVGYDDIRFMRSDAQLVKNGVTIADPSPEDLNSVVPMRDYVTVLVNISKADQDGTKFGPSLVTLLYNPNNPMSFAAAIFAYELKYPLRGKARCVTPLFTTDGVSPWSGSLIDATLAAVMRATLTPEERKGKTFHGKRVWLACGFGSPELQGSDAEIQAMVRWSSAESLKLYRRTNHLHQAQRRDQLLGATVDVYNATRRPEIGGDDPHAAAGGDGALLARAFDEPIEPTEARTQQRPRHHGRAYASDEDGDGPGAGGVGVPLVACTGGFNAVKHRKRVLTAPAYLLHTRGWVRARDMSPVVTSIAGNRSTVTDPHLLSPNLSVGQECVMDSLQGEYYFLDVFDATHLPHAEALSVYRKALAAGAVDPSSPIAVAATAAEEFITVKCKFKRSSLCGFLQGDALRVFIGEVVVRKLQRHVVSHTGALSDLEMAEPIAQWLVQRTTFRPQQSLGSFTDRRRSGWGWLPHWCQAQIIRTFALVYPVDPQNPVMRNEFDTSILALRRVCWQLHDLVEPAVATWHMYRRIRVNDMAIVMAEVRQEERAIADSRDFATLARRLMPQAFVHIVGASRVSHAQARRLFSPYSDWYMAFAHYAHKAHGDGGIQNAYPRARWMLYQVVHDAHPAYELDELEEGEIPVLDTTALAELRQLFQSRSCEALAHYAMLVYYCEHGASVGYTYDAINDLALELGGPGYTGGELEEGEVPSRIESSVWPSARGWQFAKRAMTELHTVERIVRSLPHQRFQIQYRNDVGHHQTLDDVSARDTAGEVLHRIASKHRYCGAARAKLRIVKEGKQLGLERPCGLSANASIHVMWRGVGAGGTLDEASMRLHQLAHELNVPADCLHITPDFNIMQDMPDGSSVCMHDEYDLMCLHEQRNPTPPRWRRSGPSVAHGAPRASASQAASSSSAPHAPGQCQEDVDAILAAQAVVDRRDAARATAGDAAASSSSASHILCECLWARANGGQCTTPAVRLSDDGLQLCVTCGSLPNACHLECKCLCGPCAPGMDVAFVLACRAECDRRNAAQCTAASEDASDDDVNPEFAHPTVADSRATSPELMDVTALDAAAGTTPAQCECLWAFANGAQCANPAVRVSDRGLLLCETCGGLPQSCEDECMCLCQPCLPATARSSDTMHADNRDRAPKGTSTRQAREARKLALPGSTFGLQRASEATAPAAAPGACILCLCVVSEPDPDRGLQGGEVPRGIICCRAPLHPACMRMFVASFASHDPSSEATQAYKPAAKCPACREDLRQTSMSRLLCRPPRSSAPPPDQAPPSLPPSPAANDAAACNAPITLHHRLDELAEVIGAASSTGPIDRALAAIARCFDVTAKSATLCAIMAAYHVLRSDKYTCCAQAIEQEGASLRNFEHWRAIMARRLREEQRTLELLANVADNAPRIENPATHVDGDALIAGLLGSSLAYACAPGYTCGGCGDNGGVEWEGVAHVCFAPHATVDAPWPLILAQQVAANNPPPLLLHGRGYASDEDGDGPSVSARRRALMRNADGSPVEYISYHVAVVRDTPFGRRLVAPRTVRANWAVARFGIGGRVPITQWNQHCADRRLPVHSAGFAALSVSERSGNVAHVLHDDSWDLTRTDLTPRWWFVHHDTHRPNCRVWVDAGNIVTWTLMHTVQPGTILSCDYTASDLGELRMPSWQIANAEPPTASAPPVPA